MQKRQITSSWIITPRKDMITQPGEKRNSFSETRLEKFYRPLCAPLASCNRLYRTLDAGPIFLPASNFRFVVARFMTLWVRVILCFALFCIG